MNNITRTNRNAEIVTGKILVTCKVTIDGFGTHSGTGEEWADEDNAMTSAEAQAFKRACSCFGLGRYFYDFDAPWVDIDDKSRPKKSPAFAPWMVPENWSKGQRPSGRVAASSQAVTLTARGSNRTVTSTARNGNSAPSSATGNKARQNASSNGSPNNRVKPEGTGAESQIGSELDKRIAALEETVGIKLYRWVLREHGHANQPHLVRDVRQKKKILDVLESANRGLRRMEAVLDRVSEQQVSALLAKLQAPPLNDRFETSYGLLITSHTLAPEEGTPKPKLETRLVFFHRFGLLEQELWGKDKMFRGAVAPQFFMSNGSEARVPHLYQQAVFKMTEAVTCTKCKHQHLLEPPSLEMSVADLESVKVSAAVA